MPAMLAAKSETRNNRIVRDYGSEEGDGMQ